MAFLAHAAPCGHDTARSILDIASNTGKPVCSYEIRQTAESMCNTAAGASTQTCVRASRGRVREVRHW